MKLKTFTFMCATQTVTAFNFWIHSQQPLHPGCAPCVYVSHWFISHLIFVIPLKMEMLESVYWIYWAQILCTHPLTIIRYFSNDQKGVFNAMRHTLQNNDYSWTEVKAAWIKSLKLSRSRTRFIFDWTSHDQKLHLCIYDFWHLNISIFFWSRIQWEMQIRGRR